MIVQCRSRLMFPHTHVQLYICLYIMVRNFIIITNLCHIAVQLATWTIVGMHRLDEQQTQRIWLFSIQRMEHASLNSEKFTFCMTPCCACYRETLQLHYNYTCMHVHVHIIHVERKGFHFHKLQLINFY